MLADGVASSLGLAAKAIHVVNALRVLVADDDRILRRFLRASLTANGYQYFEASPGKDTVHAVPIARPDLVILDPGWPEYEAPKLVRSLREWTDIPIVVLSVRADEADKVAVLDAGADDYLTKPFGMDELLARIRVSLRRCYRRGNSSVFTAGELTVDLVRRSVQLSNRKVQLTPTEYDLLKTLVRDSDKVLTHRQVIREVWGGTCYEDQLHLLRVNISNLRRKLEADAGQPRYIVTQPGVGYSLRTQS